jgi:hypothetical protein
MPTRRQMLNGALMALAAGALPPFTAAHAAMPSSGALTPYRSESEFVRALTRWRDAAAKLQPERRRAEAGQGAATMAAPPAAPQMADASSSLAKSAAEGLAAADSITNVQTAGVDEGGIVKRAGDFLVILRRGRLFTVRVGSDALQSEAMLDAYAPGSNPQGAWYDELLVSGSTVVVIGYSYARGGTEIGLFELGRGGSLAYRATHHLRSFDYYSSRNYASRLIGRKLVFYTPTILHPVGRNPWDMLPAMRRWHPDSTPADFTRILPAHRIYRTDDDFDPREVLALHTVTSCDLGSAAMTCESTAVLGPAGRVFYVSQGSVFVWTSSWGRRAAPHDGWPAPHRPSARPLSAVFRIPLDGAAPSAIKTAGVPIDQMSFLEDDSGHLNVLLRESGRGEGMWGSEATAGAMALLRVPLSDFGDGRGGAQREHYRVLPGVAGHEMQNRFVGDWLLWGGAADGGSNAWALRFAERADPQPLAPGHGVQRIEAMGGHAVLVGSSGADLHFSGVRLTRRSAVLAGLHVQPDASQGETRTHGFFFRPTGTDEGLLGLPVLEPGRPVRKGGVFAGGQGAASVLYLRLRDLAFHPLGRLESRADGSGNDGCKASCVDWYGNARPIFLGDRVFALLGYELVEGELSGARGRERIEERRRISFSPHGAAVNGRYSPFN